jgi:hypothetical protein
MNGLDDWNGRRYLSRITGTAAVLVRTVVIAAHFDVSGILETWKFPSHSELVKVSAHGEHVEPLNLERWNGRRTEAATVSTSS